MSKEISIHSLYNDILKELPFTISGNSSIENTLFKFLQRVAESPFLTDNSKVKFVMGGFAKIELLDLTHLFKNEWKTKRMKSFFFYDYEEDEVEFLLTIYQYCLNILTINNDGNTKSVTNFICDNNYSGVNFRVKIVSNINKIKVVFNRRDNVLEANIPQAFFNSDFDKETLSSESKLELNIERSKTNLYQYFRNKKAPSIENVVNNIFNSEFTPIKLKNNFNDFILNVNIEDNLKSIILLNPTANTNEIFYLFYIAGLLSYLLNCKIEYFTSVANTVGGRKYSLGSIAVGYKSDKLDNDTRAFFSIISNHLASNLASQILLDSSKMRNYLSKRLTQEKFLKDFVEHYKLVSNKPHSQENNIENKILPIESDKNSYNFNNCIYSKKEIIELFGEGILDYLEKLINEKLLSWGMYEGFQSAPGICCMNFNLFYGKNRLKDGNGIDIKLNSNQIDPNNLITPILKPKTNVYLPHLLIKTLIEDQKRTNPEIVTRTEDSKAIIEVKYSEDVELEKLTIALNHDSSVGGSFPDFIRDNYSAFRICGDLVIKDKDESFLISLKEDFKEYDDEEGKLKLNFIGNSNNLKPTKELIFEIHYNLF